MNVLIVDDEEWIRLGLREQVDWKALGIDIIGEAQNGAVAMEFFEKQIPDIVITDIRMPKVDGIALMEFINRRFPNVVIIVISGYSDFEYARKAISFSAFEYILKPIEEGELERTLRKAVARLKEEEGKKVDILNLKARLNENSLLFREKALTDLVLGQEAGFEEIRRNLEQMGLTMQWPCMVILVFRTPNFDAVKAAVYDNDAGLASFALSNVIEELVGSGPDSILFRNYTRQDELVLIRGFHTDEYRTIVEDIYAVCNNIIETVRQYIDFELYVGIGGEFTNLRDASKSYGQALEAVRNAGLLYGERIIHIEEISSRNDYFIYPDDKEKALLYYLENGYKSQAGELIDQLFVEMGENRNASLQSIRNAVLELAVSMGKLVKTYNFLLEEQLQEPNIAVKIMSGLFTVQDLKDWLKNASVKVTDVISSSKRPGTRKTIAQIADFVAKHYNEAINLNSVSERFFTNPAYLSRIFKSETGQNFNDYLTEIRMKAAARLLEQETLKMNDIAEMTGYENVNYFLRKFKEHYNCTPTEFRKSRL